MSLCTMTWLTVDNRFYTAGYNFMKGYGNTVDVKECQKKILGLTCTFCILNHIVFENFDDDT